MNCADNAIESGNLTVQEELAVRLPLGLLGFERNKEYLLKTSGEEEPFFWLQSPDDPSVGFFVVNPFIVLPDYHPDLPEEDARYLGLNESNDALVLSIVTVRGSTGGTINLKGPIVINRRTLVGKQVVLNNAADYSVQHPLPVAS
jgi:flagellar assembly factor FliW